MSRNDVHYAALYEHVHPGFGLICDVHVIVIDPDMT